MRREPERPAKIAKAARTARTAAPVDLSDEARPLFERLRAWRAATAKEQGVPAYVIFHDATLREFASSRPSSLEELSGITGVGENKRNRYGEQILEVLAEGA